MTRAHKTFLLCWTLKSIQLITLNISLVKINLKQNLKHLLLDHEPKLIKQKENCLY